MKTEKIKVHLKGIIEKPPEGGEICRVWLNGEELDIAPSLKLKRHSPGGFQWGYCGSGPAQLALAVLQKLFGNKAALAIYQDFKQNVIARIENGKNFDAFMEINQVSVSFEDDIKPILDHVLGGIFEGEGEMEPEGQWAEGIFK